MNMEARWHYGGRQPWSLDGGELCFLGEDWRGKRAQEPESEQQETIPETCILQTCLLVLNISPVCPCLFHLRMNGSFENRLASIVIKGTKRMTLISDYSSKSCCPLRGGQPEKGHSSRYKSLLQRSSKLRTNSWERDFISEMSLARYLG